MRVSGDPNRTLKAIKKDVIESYGGGGGESNQWMSPPKHPSNQNYITLQSWTCILGSNASQLITLPLPTKQMKSMVVVVVVVFNVLPLDARIESFAQPNVEMN